MRSNEWIGGIAYLAAKVEELRQERPSLLISAGDMIQGNNWANLFQGESVIELVNEIRCDAMVVGNHEFDFGQEVLKKRISEATFPVFTQWLPADLPNSFLPLSPSCFVKEKGRRIFISATQAYDIFVGLRIIDKIETVDIE